MIVAIDTEYDEVTKIPFICTMSDGETSKLFYPSRDKDWWMMKQICENITYEKVFHSATSDIYALSRIGIYVKPPYHCTFVMSNIIDENFSSRRLKELAKKYLHEPCLEAKELSKIKAQYKRKLGKDFRWSDIPKETIEPYAVKDAEYTIRLFKYFWPKLKESMSLYNTELDLIPIIVDMQKRGCYIDRLFCKQEMRRLEDIYIFYYNKIIKFYGKLINISSPKDIRNLLKKAGLFIASKTPKGLTSTAKEVLEPYVEEHEVIRWLLHCRNIAKQITYYSTLLEEYTSDEDPVAHFSFYQSGAKTGRFSAELIQTIPQVKTAGEVTNNVRRAFIPRYDFINFYFDYEQIEMRLFAHFTQNRSMIEKIINGMDAHEATARDLFTEEQCEDNLKQCRDTSKTVNFGIIYGMGSNKLAKTLGLPAREAHAILSRYDQLYRVKSFMSKMTSLLMRQGYIDLDWIGRKYRVPKDLAYKCVNVIIQGSAAYIIKLAMIRIFKYVSVQIIKKYGNLVNMLIQIHDELVIEIHKSLNVSEVVAEIKKLMEDYITFLVPITTDVKYSEVSWLDKKKWEIAA